MIHKLIPNREIKEKIRELAVQIKKDFPDKVHCIVILDGAKTFFASLKDELEKMDVTVDYSEIKLSSYTGKNSSRKIQIKEDIALSKNIPEILIVDDILDTGLTLSFLKDHLKEKGLRKIKIAVLLNKKARRITEIRADYIGFNIPNRFVVGFGMDYDEKYRELPSIGYIE
jgi:hypoxanthine phosphoribosyltransferase